VLRPLTCAALAPTVIMHAERQTGASPRAAQVCLQTTGPAYVGAAVSAACWRCVHGYAGADGCRLPNIPASW